MIARFRNVASIAGLSLVFLATPVIGQDAPKQEAQPTVERGEDAPAQDPEPKAEPAKKLSVKERNAKRRRELLEERVRRRLESRARTVSGEPLFVVKMMVKTYRLIEEPPMTGIERQYQAVYDASRDPEKYRNASSDPPKSRVEEDVSERFSVYEGVDAALTAVTRFLALVRKNPGAPSQSSGPRGRSSRSKESYPRSRQPAPRRDESPKLPDPVVEWFILRALENTPANKVEAEKLADRLKKDAELRREQIEAEREAEAEKRKKRDEGIERSAERAKRFRPLVPKTYSP